MGIHFLRALFSTIGLPKAQQYQTFFLAYIQDFKLLKNTIHLEPEEMLVKKLHFCRITHLFGTRITLEIIKLLYDYNLLFYVPSLHMK